VDGLVPGYAVPREIGRELAERDAPGGYIPHPDRAASEGNGQRNHPPIREKWAGHAAERRVEALAAKDEFQEL
jgi:hypothetical protein